MNKMTTEGCLGSWLCCLLFRSFFFWLSWSLDNLLIITRVFGCYLSISFTSAPVSPSAQPLLWSEPPSFWLHWPPAVSLPSCFLPCGPFLTLCQMVLSHVCLSDHDTPMLRVTSTASRCTWGSLKPSLSPPPPGASRDGEALPPPPSLPLLPLQLSGLLLPGIPYYVRVFTHVIP